MRKIARQETEALTGLNGGTRQHDTFDQITFERIDRTRDRQIGLAGARRSYAKGNVVRLHLPDVLRLMVSAGAQISAPRLQCNLFDRREFCGLSRFCFTGMTHFDDAQLDFFNR